MQLFGSSLGCRCLEGEEISKVAGASQLMAFKDEGLSLCTDLSVQQRASKGSREPGRCPRSHIDAAWTDTPRVEFSVCPASFLYVMSCNNQYHESWMFRPPRPAVLCSGFGGSLSTAWRCSSKIHCQKALPTRARSSPAQWSVIKRKGCSAVAESVDCAFISPAAEPLQPCQGSLCAPLCARAAVQDKELGLTKRALLNSPFDVSSTMVEFAHKQSWRANKLTGEKNIVVTYNIRTHGNLQSLHASEWISRDNLCKGVLRKFWQATQKSGDILIFHTSVL